MEVLLFYGARKRDNSTLVPTGGVSFIGTLKDECDMLAPSILFDMGNANPTHYTMAYIPDFGRYYFCDWTFRGSRHWWCNMSIDVLASWKSSIGVSDLYVLRSAQERDYYLPDNQYPAKMNAQYSFVRQGSPFAANYQSGCFVLACVGGFTGSAINSGVTYYWITPNALQDLVNRMFNNNGLTDDWTQFFEKKVADPNEDIPLKLFINPADFIQGCIWLPYFTIPYSGTAVTVKFGYFNSTAAALTINEDTKTVNVSVDYSSIIPTSATTEFWKYYAPYSEYEMYIPIFGSLKLDAATLIGNASRTIDIEIDTIIFTGDSIATIKIGSAIIGKMAANVAVPVMLGGAKADIQGLVKSAANLVNDVADISAQHGLIDSAIQAGKTAITGKNQQVHNVTKTATDFVTGVAKMYTPKVSTMGTQGGNADMHNDIQIVRRYFEPAEQDPAHYGYPLCQIKRISALAGFIKVADGDVECSATQTEKAMIRQYLEGGFYYE